MTRMTPESVMNDTTPTNIIQPLTEGGGDEAKLPPSGADGGGGGEEEDDAKLPPSGAGRDGGGDGGGGNGVEWSVPDTYSTFKPWEEFKTPFSQPKPAKDISQYRKWQVDKWNHRAGDALTYIKYLYREGVFQCPGSMKDMSFNVYIHYPICDSSHSCNASISFH